MMSMLRNCLIKGKYLRPLEKNVRLKHTKKDAHSQPYPRVHLPGGVPFSVRN